MAATFNRFNLAGTRRQLLALGVVCSLGGWVRFLKRPLATCVNHPARKYREEAGRFAALERAYSEHFMRSDQELTSWRHRAERAKLSGKHPDEYKLAWLSGRRAWLLELTEYARRMRRKYEFAARLPWMPIAADPPTPPLGYPNEKHTPSIIRWSRGVDEIEAALVRDDPAELVAVLSAALHANDPAWGESLCARLARHYHEQVRGNAILGFAHLARVHRLLTERTVRPLVDAALADPSGYVRGQAESTADDLGMYLGWNFHRPT